MVGADPEFIGGLADLVRRAVLAEDTINATGRRLCPAGISSHSRYGASARKSVKRFSVGRVTTVGRAPARKSVERFSP